MIRICDLELKIRITGQQAKPYWVIGYWLIELLDTSPGTGEIIWLPGCSEADPQVKNDPLDCVLAAVGDEKASLSGQNPILSIFGIHF